jgi:hypothetical protein
MRDCVSFPFLHWSYDFKPEKKSKINRQMATLINGKKAKGLKGVTHDFSLVFSLR